MKALLFAIIFSQLFIFCSNNATEPSENTFLLSDTLIINYKQVFVNDESSIRIKFDSVLNDSRCPVDVVCFWEGDAELNFILSKGSEKISFNLHTAFNYFTKDTVLLGYYIELLDVYPYPHSKKIIRLNDYKAKIFIDSEIKE